MRSKEDLTTSEWMIFWLLVTLIGFLIMISMIQSHTVDKKLKKILKVEDKNFLISNSQALVFK